MSTEFFPGRKVDPENFYLSCCSPTSTLVGYKGRSSTCPFVQFIRYQVPGCNGSETQNEFWRVYNEHVKVHTGFGDEGGLESLPVKVWNELFEKGNDISGEWGFGDQKRVYFIGSDEICLYRISMAFE